jgi:tetratricopeptide (TPR) repeat protein
VFEAERCYRQAQQLYLLEGDDQAALEAIDLALRVCPVKAKAMVLKAEILFSLGSYKTALAVIEDAILARPGWAEPYLSKTNILAVLGRYVDANAACSGRSSASSSTLASSATNTYLPPFHR